MSISRPGSGPIPLVQSKRAARRAGRKLGFARRWNNEGLDLTAAGLRRAVVAVF
jgi:hypothetical protein